MTSMRAPVWQLILADLALILFLVTLTALAGEEAHGVSKPPDDTKPEPQSAPQIAQAQALFRPNPLGPSLAQWLDDQSPDPRATLTVFANHAQGEYEGIWAIARAMGDEAQGRGFGVRVVIAEAQVSDIYASLAYDGPAYDTPNSDATNSGPPDAAPRP